MKPIPYARHSIDQADIDAVAAAMLSGFLTQGPGAGEFERRLAQKCGSRYAAVFSSGTAALHGAYFAAGLSAGDELVTSPITFCATANAGLYLGASPVLCDISLGDYTIDQDRLWRCVTPRTKVIAPVAYAGFPISLGGLREKAAKAGIAVVLDAAHALGAELAGEPVGKHADMAVLSFHPAKHVAAGEGGAVLTDDGDYYEKLISFRSHGIVKNPGDAAERGVWYQEMRGLGYNYRLTDIQCALGISQLEKLDASLARRERIAARYKAGLGGLGWLTLPPEPAGGRHAWHLYPVLVKENRRGFFDYLHENGILAQVHYVPIHYMPYYKEITRFRRGDFPRAEEFYEREVSLPMFPALTDAEQGYVIDTVRRYDA